jgi:hypothetical protein
MNIAFQLIVAASGRPLRECVPADDELSITERLG